MLCGGVHTTSPQPDLLFLSILGDLILLSAFFFFNKNFFGGFLFFFLFLVCFFKARFLSV